MGRKAFLLKRSCMLLLPLGLLVAFLRYNGCREKLYNLTTQTNSDNRLVAAERRTTNGKTSPLSPLPQYFPDAGEDEEQEKDDSSTSSPEVLERKIAEDVTRLGITQPLNPEMRRGHWQVVSDTREIYLYSAYYDDRISLARPCVRIIGVADTGVRRLYCLLWYTTGNTPEVSHAVIRSVGPDIRPSSGVQFGQYIFSCLVPQSQSAPSNVSLVTPYNLRTSNSLEVRIPVKPASPSDVIEFGHCMSVVYWEVDPLRVVEWLELHRIWGVREVNIYGCSLNNATTNVLVYYARTGFVKYHEISTVLEDEDEPTILMNMSPVINDCLYRNLYRYRYVVCTDFDEMIVPRSAHLTYSSMLKAAMTKHQGKIKSFAFRNAYFFLDYGPIRQDPWFLVTPRYQTRVRPSRFGYSCKSITRTSECLGLQNHYCWEPLDGMKEDPGWNVDVEKEVGMNHHYKRCHFDQYLGKDGVCLRLMVNSFRDRTMEKFVEELAERVTVVLVELQLVDTRTSDIVTTPPLLLPPQIQ